MGGGAAGTGNGAGVAVGGVTVGAADGAGIAGGTAARSTIGAGVRDAHAPTMSASAPIAIPRGREAMSRVGRVVVIEKPLTPDAARQARPGSSGTNLTASRRCSRKPPAAASITVRYCVPRSTSSVAPSGITMRPPGLR